MQPEPFHLASTRSLSSLERFSNLHMCRSVIFPSRKSLFGCLFLGTPSKLWFSVWFPLKTHQTRGAFKIHDTHLYHMPAKAKQEKRTCFRSRDLGSCSSLGCALCWRDCVHKLRHTQGLSKRRELIRVIRKKVSASLMLDLSIGVQNNERTLAIWVRLSFLGVPTKKVIVPLGSL